MCVGTVHVYELLTAAIADTQIDCARFVPELGGLMSATVAMPSARGVAVPGEPPLAGDTVAGDGVLDRGGGVRADGERECFRTSLIICDDRFALGDKLRWLEPGGVLVGVLVGQLDAPLRFRLEILLEPDELEEDPVLMPDHDTSPSGSSSIVAKAAASFTLRLCFELRFERTTGFLATFETRAPNVCS